MRPDDKACPHCGGDPGAGHAAATVAFPECGCLEPPPKSIRRRGDRPSEQPLPRGSRASERTPAVPLIALVDVQPGSRQMLEGLCTAHGRQVVCCSPAMTSAEDATLMGVELVVIEADRGGLAVALARRLRGRVAAVPIAVVLTSWSESEADAQSAAEFVIHAPLREREISGLLERIDSASRSLLSPLLATAFRERLAG